MRNITLSVLIGGLICLAMPNSRAAADDDDACRMFLCMAGKVQGNGEAGGCGGAISSYFSYQVKDPDFDPGKTASLRDGVIGRCEGIGSDSSGRNIVFRQSISLIYGGLPFDL